MQQENNEPQEGSLKPLELFIAVIGIAAALAVLVFLCSSNVKHMIDDTTMNDIRSTVKYIKNDANKQENDASFTGANEEQIKDLLEIDSRIIDGYETVQGVKIKASGNLQLGYCVYGMHPHGNVAHKQGFVYASNEGRIEAGKYCNHGNFENRPINIEDIINEVENHQSQ